MVAMTAAEKEAARVAAIEKLQAQLKDLEPKPPELTDLSDQELHISFHDELVQLLGAHPRLDAIWQEIRRRLLPAPADVTKKAA